MTCLILASKYYCETQDIVVNIDICRLMGIRGGETTGVSPTQSYVQGADKLMEMELRLLELIDYQLFVPIQEFNETQSIFNSKIKSERQACERETVADSQSGEINQQYLRNQRIYKSFNDLTVSKEVSKIQKKQNSTPQ